MQPPEPFHEAGAVERAQVDRVGEDGEARRVIAGAHHADEVKLHRAAMTRLHPAGDVEEGVDAFVLRRLADEAESHRRGRACLRLQVDFVDIRRQRQHVGAALGGRQKARQFPSDRRLQHQEAQRRRVRGG